MHATRFPLRFGWFMPACLLALACLIPACSDTSTGTGDDVQPTFSSIQTKIFAKSCATSSCHGSLGQRGGLTLEGDAAYNNLVNAMPGNEVAAARGLRRVVPGKPDSSFLMIKLTGPASGEGDRMPQQNGSLSTQQLDAIRTWIANGAQKN